MLNAISWNSELKWLNDIEGQSQWLPFSIPGKSIQRCMFSSYLVISESNWQKLRLMQRWPPFSLPAKSIPWCIFGANLVILAHICDKLSSGQGKVCTNQPIHTIWMIPIYKIGMTQCYSFPLQYTIPASENLLHTINKSKTMTVVFI